jgi:hypothetical protein
LCVCFVLALPERRQFDRSLLFDRLVPFDLQYRLSKLRWRRVDRLRDERRRERRRALRKLQQHVYGDACNQRHVLIGQVRFHVFRGL